MLHSHLFRSRDRSGMVTGLRDHAAYSSVRQVRRGLRGSPVARGMDGGDGHESDVEQQAKDMIMDTDISFENKGDLWDQFREDCERFSELTALEKLQTALNDEKEA